MTDRLTVTYRIRATAATIAARAQSVAVEQSVEMPIEAISDETVLRDIVGQIQNIADRGDGSFLVQIGLAMATIGTDAGQLFNMLFGNVSLQEDITLEDVSITPALARVFAGPNFGMNALRERVGAANRRLPASPTSRRALPKAGWILSRTTTAWRTRLTEALPTVCQKLPPRSAPPGPPRAMCRQCRAISTRCGRKCALQPIAGWTPPSSHQCWQGSAPCKP